ncbi:MAG TPA: DMT family transporter [Candidatus Prevotella avicola]|uniref:DMT family transporter n=1 Tax=Candidatus Prevotella avicola TaxID=2838738 RepID=A0A9D2FXN0_9BACT|nr:DMT family transporter [Candidatus Prevotella avicola]
MASIEAIYGRLGVCLGSAVRSSTMSFLIGTAAIVAFSVGSGKMRCVRKAFSKQNPCGLLGYSVPLRCLCE